MSFFRHFGALLCKNLRLKMRTKCISAAELLFPPLLVLIMVGLYGIFEAQTTPTTQYVESRTPVVPFGFMPARLTDLTWNLGVAAKSDDPALIAARDNFVSWLDQTHPVLNGSQAPFTTAAMKATYVPAPSSVIRKFKSNQEVTDYVRNDDYAVTTSFPRLSAVIVFNEAGPNWDYSIRMNFTDLPNTFNPVNELQRNANLGSIGEYIAARPSAVSRAQSAPLPSFSTLQLEVDRFLLNRTIPALTMADIDVTAFIATKLVPMAATYPAFGAELQAMARNPAAAAGVVSAMLPFLGSERYAPHGLSFLSFPIVGYTSNTFFSVVQNIFPFFFVLMMLFPVAMLLRGLVSEKELKLREALKMMGVNSAALTSSWVAQYTLVFLVQALLIALIGAGTVFKASDFGSVFLLFFLFGVSSVAFVVFISVFFTRTKLATIVGVLLYLALYFVFTATSGDEIPFGSKVASALAGPTAFSLGIKSLTIFEDQGIGLQLGTNTGVVIRNWSFDASLYMMAVDTVLYLLLGWYLDEVMPASFREFGIPRPFYFPFTPAYWREVFGLVPNAEPMDLSGGGKRFQPAGHDDEFFETPGTDLLSRGANGQLAAIRGLRREFGSFTAVDNIDLDCFEGQITVILGHNGAGKSTTFNMLTGLIPSTAGGASVYGNSTTTQMNEIRHNLGVCPQHDVLWPTLTVREHLSLFAEVKQLASDTIKSSIESIVATVGLTEKIDQLSSSLSGGQKRKLSVAIALLGDPKLVILDEPTSGMDPYSRRATWELLRKAREGRTIILTTHFMDEADLLGDRVAIMSHGKVECCGSPMFLKSKLNAGYEMTIVKRQPTADSDLACDSDALAEAIARHVPGTVPDTDIGAEMRVKLGFGAAPQLPALFDELDADMALPDEEQRIGLLTYGVSVTSIESVFLTVASGKFRTPDAADDAAPGKASAEGAASAAPTKVAVAPAPGSRDPESGKVAHATLSDVRARARKDEFTACGRFWTHFYALLCKRVSYQARDWRFFCCSILLPGLIVIFGLALLISAQLTSFPSLALSTDMVNIKPVDGKATNLPFRVPTFSLDASVFPAADNTYPGSVVANGNMPNTTANAIAYDATITNTYSFMNASAVPGTPGVNTAYQLSRMSTWLLQNRANHEESRFGAVVFGREAIRPAGLTLEQVPQASVFVNTSARHGAGIMGVLLSNAIAKAGGGSRVSSIRVTVDPLPFTARQQLVFGQFGSLSASLVIIIAFAFVSLAPVSFVVRERETSAKHQQQLAGVSILSYWLSSYLWDFACYLVPMVITIATVAGYNLTDFIGEDGRALEAFLGVMFLYGLCGTAFAYLVGHAFKSNTAAQVAIQLLGVVSLLLTIVSFVLSIIPDTCVVERSLRYVFLLFPGFALGNGLLQISFRTTLPFLIATCDAANDVDVDRPTSYEATDMDVAGINMVYLAAFTVVYLALAIAVDVIRNNPSVLACFCPRSGAVDEPPADDDDDVANERRRVQTGSDKDLENDVVVLNRLTKTYPGGKKAVRGLSFGVKVGQVFGFLGINGAGKTTTLKMLSGDELPSAGGAARIAGFDILTEQDRVRRLLGYCPQFDALLDLLTVREHLFLFARIKGVPESEIPGLVETKMDEMGLTMYADRISSALSGGNRRKLSMAIALVSEPPVVFADEPSTGMDPKARRDMWKIILRIARSKATSVVLTSHSMEEVEALCSRVGIMVGGQMRCLGSIQHLKNKFGKGWMIEVRQKGITAEQIDAVRVAARKAGVVTRVGGEAADAEECVVRDSLGALFAELGHREWEEEVHPKRSGWMVQAAIDARPGNDVPLDLLAAWVAEQRLAESLVRFVTVKTFKPSEGDEPRLIERHGAKFRFRIPPQDMSLGDMFRGMEDGREDEHMADYSIGQTSLEQVFNQFAAQQEQETGEMEGMVAAPPTAGKAASAAKTAPRHNVESPLAAASAPRADK